MFSITLKALDRAIEFIEDNNLLEPERIDYVTYLLGLFVYLDENELMDVQKSKVIEWYQNVIFAKKDNGERRNIFERLIQIAY
ncbi:hypothetical protein JCM1393_02540 [Clostridium carnis]